MSFWHACAKIWCESARANKERPPVEDIAAAFANSKVLNVSREPLMAADDVDAGIVSVDAAAADADAVNADGHE